MREVALLVCSNHFRGFASEERLSPSSENKWMFYLGEGPRMEALQAAEGRMAWAGQTLEEIRMFSELKRSSEGHSKAVWSKGRSR